MFLCIAIATSTYAQITVDSKGRSFLGDSVNVTYPSSVGSRHHGTLGAQTTLSAYGDYEYGFAARSISSAQFGPAIDYTYHNLNSRRTFHKWNNLHHRRLSIRVYSIILHRW